MQVFDFDEFAQDITKVFSLALIDEVIINYDEKNSYKLLPIKNNNKTESSPFRDVPRIKLNITTQEIVEILRDCRAGV